MTGLEAIPKIAALLSQLIPRLKDRKAAALVQQIQQHQLVIQKELIEARAKISQTERDHANVIAEINERHAKTIAHLNEKIAKFQSEMEIRYHAGTEFRRGKKTGEKWQPFCPDCGLPLNIPTRNYQLSCACGWESNIWGSQLPGIVAKFVP